MAASLRPGQPQRPARARLGVPTARAANARRTRPARGRADQRVPPPGASANCTEMRSCSLTSSASRPDERHEDHRLRRPRRAGMVVDHIRAPPGRRARSRPARARAPRCQRHCHRRRWWDRVLEDERRPAAGRGMPPGSTGGRRAATRSARRGRSPSSASSSPRTVRRMRARSALRAPSTVSRPASACSRSTCTVRRARCRRRAIGSVGHGPRSQDRGRRRSRWTRPGKPSGLGEPVLCVGSRRYLRRLEARRARSASSPRLELFLGTLVDVFAIGQLSHRLHDDRRPADRGVETTMLALAVGDRLVHDRVGGELASMPDRLPVRELLVGRRCSLGLLRCGRCSS